LLRIARRLEIGETNAICTVAAISTAEWKQIDPASNQILKQVKIDRVIENPSFTAGQFASTTIHTQGDSLQVYAEYLAELTHLGRLPPNQDEHAVPPFNPFPSL
jgi:hypothetical protein